MTITILIIVNVFTALAIIVLALMQQSKGDMGSAFGGGGSQSMFGSRGSANFLSRMTSLMCVIFFASSLSLAYIYAQRAENSSVVSGGSVDTEQAAEIDNEIPSIEGVEEANDNEIPVIESEIPTIESDSTENPVPAEAADAAEVVETTAESIEEAVEQATEAEEVPQIPQQ
jgi:preprotein translocase subunit SecG